MKGSKLQRDKNVWLLRFPIGYEVGPDGKRRRKNHQETFHGGAKEADARLRDLILEKGLDQVPELPDNTGQMHFSFPETPRFSRDIGKLLAGL